ncbi:Crp/Fnr family transcriptional regulator [Parasulfitobacter algicola]|uniref:Crp/Fnr family transcriptional regulator n=1 Tax=Parasulfitobacter algicola TaxID=2614809 RepID=A0ABX2IT72_9RHOB|nr:Crp/Fnr family transcriptional regulator [Sulfitobacter algicola]NSX54007.1 Crp/Fnr family transcriptional regulator [Sulfitobacter algicola]
MTTDCNRCPLRKLPAFVEFNRNDLSFMQKFKSGELTIDPKTPLLMEGSNSPQLFTSLRGMGLRYKTLEDGQRQVINFVFPGDFIGMQAAVMGEMCHSVEATTSMTLCVFNRSEFWNFFKENPERAFDLTWLSAVEEHFLGEALTSIGQRTAMQAMSWAFVRIFLRGQSLGMVENAVMPLPYKQQDIADALGLSLVHTNKTLAKLRDLQLASWSDGVLQINDLEALAEIAHTSSDPLPERPLI